MTRMIQSSQGHKPREGGERNRRSDPPPFLGFGDPMIAAFLMRSPVPIFSGEDTDFEGWALEFQKRSDLMRQMLRGEAVDTILFNDLREALDQGGKDFEKGDVGRTPA